MSALDRALAKLPGAKKVGREWRVRCPAHEDANPSLDVTQGDRGVVFTCRAGCKSADVVAAVGRLGLAKSDLFDGPATRSAVRETLPKHRWPVTARYVYQDCGGDPVYRANRKVSPDSGEKTFAMERYANGAWVSGMDGVDRILFHLPELIAALADVVVYVVEGEKCALAVEGLGLLGTSAAGGTGGIGQWSDAVFVGPLRGRHVVILSDNDDKGRAYAKQVALDLANVAASVKVLHLPGLGPKGDVVDWIAAGGSAEELRRLAEDAPTFDGAAMVDTAARVAVDRSTATTVCLADIEPRDVDWLIHGRLPKGMLAVLDGDTATGKTTTVCDLIGSLTTGRPWAGAVGKQAPRDVVMLGHEDSPHHTIRPRLDAAGADCARVHLLTDIDGRLPKFPDDCDAIETLIQRKRAALMVIDPISAYLGGVDLNQDGEIRGALAPLVVLAERTGVTVLMIRHLRKSGGVSALHRGLGSVAISALARTAMMLLMDPDDPSGEARILTWTKLSVGPAPKSLRWRLGPATASGRPPGIVWDATPCDLSADAILDRQDARPERRGVVDDVADWLRQALAGGEVPAAEIESRARAAGYSTPAYRRARAAIGARSIRRGTAWYVVPGPAGQDDHVPLIRNHDHIEYVDHVGGGVGDQHDLDAQGVRAGVGDHLAAGDAI